MKRIFFWLKFPRHLPFEKKKLGKKISDAAENTVTDKSADKTSDEVGKGMDGIFSQTKKSGKDLASPKNTYSFSYNYQMKISSKNTALKMDYYIDPGSDYIAMAMNKNGMNMFMVFDYDKEANYNFISRNGNKMMTTTSLNTNYSNDWVNNDYNKSDYTVTSLPNKTFLGYSCKGKQLENDRYKMIIYYTDKVDINMQDLFHARPKGGQNEAAAVLQKQLPDMEKSLMMYLKTTDKKDGDGSAVMECTKLEKVDRDFDTDGYQSMN